MGRGISMEPRSGEEKTVRERGEVAEKLLMPVSQCFESLQMVQLHDADSPRSEEHPRFEEHPTQSQGGASEQVLQCLRTAARGHKQVLSGVRQGNVCVCVMTSSRSSSGRRTVLQMFIGGCRLLHRRHAVALSDLLVDCCA